MDNKSKSQEYRVLRWIFIKQNDYKEVSIWMLVEY